MAADETIRVELKAISKDYERKIKSATQATANLDDVTEDYFRTVRGGLIRQRALATRLDATSKNAKVTTNSLEGLRKAAQSLGGRFGELSEKGANAAEAIQLLGGPASAVVGATVAIVAMGAAGAAAALKMSDLIEELDDLGRAEGITQEQRDAAESLKNAMEAITVSVKTLTVSLGAEFAPAVETAADAILVITESLRTLDRETEGIQKIGEAGTFLATLPWQAIKAGISGLAEPTREADEALREYQETLDSVEVPDFHLPFVTGAEVAAEAADETAKKQEEAAKKAEDAAKKAAAARVQAIKQAQGIEDAAIASTLSGADAIIFTRDQQIAKLDELARAGVDVAAARAAVNAQAQQQLQELSMAEAEAAKATQDRYKANAEAYRQSLDEQRMADDVRAQEQAARDEEEKKRRQEQLQADAAQVASVVSTAAAAGDAVIDLINVRTKAGRQAALVAFRINQGLQIASAISNVAAGVTQSLALPPPLSFINAAAVSSIGAAQIAKISSTRPQFHRGTSGSTEADEVLLRSNESAAVLTAQAREAGAGEAVNRGNAGLSAGMGSMVIQTDHRYHDVQIRESTRRQGSALARQNRKNRPAIGHSRRRR